MVTLQIHDMLPKTFFHAVSGDAQIKKVRVQVLDRGIYLKSTLLNKSASSSLGH